MTFNSSTDIWWHQTESVTSGTQQRTWTSSRGWLFNKKSIVTGTTNSITATDGPNSPCQAPFSDTVDGTASRQARTRRTAVSSVSIGTNQNKELLLSFFLIDLSDQESSLSHPFSFFFFFLFSMFCFFKLMKMNSVPVWTLQLITYI